MLKQDIKTKETDVKFIKKVAPASEKELSNAPKAPTKEDRPPRTGGGCIPVAGD